MNPAKPSRRKIGANKLEPIDWHEYANDAVLNGNMSTLYHRPPSEDPTAYASAEAMVEIEKRVGRPVAGAVVIDSNDAALPTVGPEPRVGSSAEASVPSPSEVFKAGEPTMGPEPTVGLPNAELTSTKPTEGRRPTVGLVVPFKQQLGIFPAPPTAGSGPAVGLQPSVGPEPTVGLTPRRRVRAIFDVQDALTLAGQVLYKAMYGPPDGARSKSCTKGYRQLAAETHLDKDTVRDLIGEFKDKGMVRETGTYDPDTRSSKTYEVLSYKAILQIWRDAGLGFVTAGRQRPVFCTAQGEPLAFEPTMGPGPRVAKTQPPELTRPTVGPIAMVQRERKSATEVVQALQQITGNPVDQEAADRLIGNCRTEAPDSTIEEIVEFAWSKAFLCRSGKIENPIGFLITQIPKHFQGEALQAYRESKRKELEAAAATAAREERRRREADHEIAEAEEKQRVRGQFAERHRKEQGIDLKSLLQDSEADDVLKEWAKRMLKFGHRYQPHYT